MRERRPASRLRVERIKAGWGLKALAAAIGHDRSSLYRIETGVIKEPRQEIRQKLAKALGVREAVLFGK